jgi:hypothetical protein
MASFISFLKTSVSSRKTLEEPCSSYSNQLDDSIQSVQESDCNHGLLGAEWVHIIEPIGFFLPQLKRKLVFLVLDQVRNVLHYDNYKYVLHIEEISLVTPVEEISPDGTRQWWMSIQDPSTPQEWVIHFSSLERLEAWISLLRIIVHLTKSLAIVDDMVITDWDAPAINSSPEEERIIDEIATA